MALVGEPAFLPLPIGMAVPVALIVIVPDCWEARMNLGAIESSETISSIVSPYRRFCLCFMAFLGAHWHGGRYINVLLMTQ